MDNMELIAHQREKIVVLMNERNKLREQRNEFKGQLAAANALITLQQESIALQQQSIALTGLCTQLADLIGETVEQEKAYWIDAGKLNWVEQVIEEVRAGHELSMGDLELFAQLLTRMARHKRLEMQQEARDALRKKVGNGD